MSKKVNKKIIIICAIIGILLIFGAFLTPKKEKPTTEPSPASTSMTIDEAQIKCMLMEEADLVKYDGATFGNETTKKARNNCLEKWDMSKNPNNTEEQFIKVITSSWEVRKTEVLEGYTLEELYNESMQ